MASRTIAGLYDAYGNAVKTVRDLQAAGISDDEISVVANTAADLHRSTGDDESSVATETGVTFGTLVGGGAGLLAGFGVIAIPGIGPVVAAGWLVTAAFGAAIGAAAGAAAGGLVGTLTESGVSEADAQVYAEGIRRGGTIVTARVDEARAIEISLIMERYGAVDPALRRQLYLGSGWTEFDAGARPDTPSAVERERDFHDGQPTL
jgi:hypothetical protein